MNNPVLKYDIKIRLRISKLITALALRYAFAGFLVLLVLLLQLGTGILAFIIAEVVLISLTAPGIVCDAFNSRSGRDSLIELSLTKLGARSIIFGRFMASLFYNEIFVLLSAIIMIMIVLIRHSSSGVLGILYASVALFIVNFALSVTGMLLVTIFRRNLLISSVLAYAIILLLLGSVIIVGPFMERIKSQQAKDAITKAALYANPVIMVSRSLGKVDILRTQYLYNLADPIVGRGFTYPDTFASWIVYFGVSCLMLAIAMAFSPQTFFQLF